MRLLLDTHLLLWMVGDRSALSSKAKAMLEDSQNDLLFSPVSLFEVAVKALRKREDFVVNVRELRQELLLQSVVELPLFSDHALEIALLPPFTMTRLIGCYLHKPSMSRLRS